MKKLIYIGLILVAVTFLVSNYSENNLENKDDSSSTSRNGTESTRLTNSRGNCLADDCLAISELEYPVSALPENVVNALSKAIDDEYKAYSTYDAVIARHGSIRPFIMILRAEEQHISSLKSIFDKYGIEIPKNLYLSKVSSPTTVSEACSIGVQAEIDNAALYREDLLPAVKDYEDITLVFNSLMDASQTKHLPSFEKCSN